MFQSGTDMKKDMSAACLPRHHTVRGLPARQGRPGAALLLVIIISSIFMVLAVFLLKIAYNNYVTASSLLQREEAFWLAEAGLEKGKVEINLNPFWYTDLPYYLQDNLEWLKSGAVGEKNSLGQGCFKIIREREKNRLYSIGFKGKALVVLKVGFTSPPFKALSWEEL